MASIMIRNLDDDVKTRLRVRAADNDRSMEEEARLILRDAVGRKPDPRNLTSIIRSHFGPANGVDLELPPRETGRVPRPLIELAAMSVLLDTNVVSELIRKAPEPAVAAWAYADIAIEVVDPWAAA